MNKYSVWVKSLIVGGLLLLAACGSREDAVETPAKQTETLAAETSKDVANGVEAAVLSDSTQKSNAPGFVSQADLALMDRYMSAVEPGITALNPVLQDWSQALEEALEADEGEVDYAELRARFVEVNSGFGDMKKTMEQADAPRLESSELQEKVDRFQIDMLTIAGNGAEATALYVDAMDTGDDAKFDESTQKFSLLYEEMEAVETSLFELIELWKANS